MMSCRLVKRTELPISQSALKIQATTSSGGCSKRKKKTPCLSQSFQNVSHVNETNEAYNPFRQHFFIDIQRFLKIILLFKKIKHSFQMMKICKQTQSIEKFKRFISNTVQIKSHLLHVRGHFLVPFSCSHPLARFLPIQQIPK
ncbi:hypothetical protein NPIL_212601 [Nephila pilipes]|uniref:Uncharacterized protein n=1 Tax=Nephila pilipes TaxID=299642 RepID=A0A8X6NNH3_NEPPI|nr:hypothetical protein NPIL_212601 [Nephila pilipes]